MPFIVNQDILKNAIDISPEKFKEEMLKIKASSEKDPEAAHGDADDLMCKVLRQLGYASGIDVFDNRTAWYS